MRLVEGRGAMDGKSSDAWEGTSSRSSEEKVPEGGDARADESAGQASRKRRVSGPDKTRRLFRASKCCGPK